MLGGRMQKQMALVGYCASLRVARAMPAHKRCFTPHTPFSFLCFFCEWCCSFPQTCLLLQTQGHNIIPTAVLLLRYNVLFNDIVTGAVFETSLPPDLADIYRRLAVLLPQAPIPLVTVLQLWGVTDPHEAQETVQIFVMQGVLKVATLPDGATWLMVSPEHQQYILVGGTAQQAQLSYACGRIFSFSLFFFVLLLASS
jgi:hypothetical protein